MTTKTLKKSMGEGGAFIGDSHGEDRLLDVLTAFAEGLSEMVTAHQATIATATIGGILVASACKMTSLRTSVAVCGTADNTTVQAHLNGASQGELTTANDDTDGTKQALALDVDLVAGDLVELVVSAAPTAGTGLTATIRMQPVAVE